MGRVEVEGVGKKHFNLWPCIEFRTSDDIQFI